MSMEKRSGGSPVGIIVTVLLGLAIIGLGAWLYFGGSLSPTPSQPQQQQAQTQPQPDAAPVAQQEGEAHDR